MEVDVLRGGDLQELNQGAVHRARAGADQRADVAQLQLEALADRLDDNLQVREVLLEEACRMDIPEVDVAEGLLRTSALLKPNSVVATWIQLPSPNEIR